MRKLSKLPSLKDFEDGADKIHYALDGKIHLPDALCVVIVGVTGAVLPVWLLIHWMGVTF